MAYDVTKTNGQRLAVVPDRTVDQSSSLRLLGKNFPSYGEIMAENLVALLENFSNATAPANPIMGQLWYKTTDNVLYLNVTGTANGWYPIGGKDMIGGVNNGFETSTIKDKWGNYYPAIKIKVDGVIIAIVSGARVNYEPHQDTGLRDYFAWIYPGINMNDGQQGEASSDYSVYKIRGRSMEAEFADMAEIYIADDYLQAGNIVRLGGEKEITKTISSFDDQVFGVVSTAPGFLLNSKMKLQEFAYPVALKGRVPCIVTGEVRKGQRIVASDIPGVGMATDKFDPATIIGRAISEKRDGDIGTVEVAIGVR